MAGAFYTPAEIDDMPWCDVLSLFDHWSRWPPPNEAIRRIGIGLGIEKEVKRLPKFDKNTAPPGFLSIAELEKLHRNDPSGIGGLIRAYPSGHVPAGRPHG